MFLGELFLGIIALTGLFNVGYNIYMIAKTIRKYEMNEKILQQNYNTTLGMINDYKQEYELLLHEYNELNKEKV